MKTTGLITAVLSLSLLHCSSTPDKGPVSPMPDSNEAAPPSTDEGTGAPAEKTVATNKQELVQAALDALKSGDPDNYIALMMTLEEAKQHCPEVEKITAERQQEGYAAARADFAKCMALGDWGGASLDEIRGGEVRETLRGCADSIQDVKKIKFWVKLGDKLVHVKLDDPVVLNGNEWRSPGDGPRCREDN